MKTYAKHIFLNHIKHCLRQPKSRWLKVACLKCFREVLRCFGTSAFLDSIDLVATDESTELDEDDSLGEQYIQLMKILHKEHVEFIKVSTSF